MDSNEPPTIVTDGTSATITPFIAEVAFQDFVAPEPLNVSVTADIGGCSNTANFNAVVECILPLRRRTTTTCAWVKIGWQRSPDAGHTVYGEAPTQTSHGPQTTLPLASMWCCRSHTCNCQRGKLSRPLTLRRRNLHRCWLDLLHEKPFGLFRRQAPNFSVNGEDSRPLNDLVLCEGENVTLNSFINQNGASEAFSWAQYVDDSDGNSILEPLSSNTFTALFVDVAPSKHSTKPHLKEGLRRTPTTKHRV